MPEICRFYGIVSRMFFADHLPAHFHAEYGRHVDAVPRTRIVSTASP
jgi:hypothetical protein